MATINEGRTICAPWLSTTLKSSPYSTMIETAFMHLCINLDVCSKCRRHLTGRILPCCLTCRSCTIEVLDCSKRWCRGFLWPNFHSVARCILTSGLWWSRGAAIVWSYDSAMQIPWRNLCVSSLLIIERFSFGMLYLLDRTDGNPVLDFVEMTRICEVDWFALGEQDWFPY